MIVVHGLWPVGGRLCLWGEDTSLPEVPPRRAGRRPRVQQHPFAASHEVLGALLGSKGVASTIELVLPSHAGPVASPELVRDVVPTARGAVELRAWSVPTFEYEADEAFALLRSDLLGAVAPPELATGASSRLLVAVADFAAELTARGRLLPAVVGEEARWLPVVTGPDAATLRSLALALPPSARGSGTAASVVAAALDALVDAAARAVLPGADQPAGLVEAAAVFGAAQGTSGPERATGSGRDTSGSGRAGSGAGWRGAAAAARRGVVGAAGAWLSALTGRQRRFVASADERVALAADLAMWQRDAAGGAVRACFRLVEPPPELDETWFGGDDRDRLDEEARVSDSAGAGDSGDADLADAGLDGAGLDGASLDGGDLDGSGMWRLDFALQAAHEPSLVVDAEQVWRSRGALKALARHIDAPQETLLGELGRASRLYPDLEAALHTAKPSTLTLDAAGAYRLLREGAPRLAAAGFGVLLPGWWSRPSARFGARLSARGAGAAPGTVAKESGMGLDALVDYKWELALGDEPLTEDELQRLTRLKAPLVRLRGQWVELDPRRLAAGLRMMAEPPGRLTVGELLHVAGSAGDGPGGLPVVGVEADGWLGDLLAGDADQRLAPVEAPAGFVGDLRPYQQRGLSWLSFLEQAGLGGILADDMGLGKTVQLLALLARDRDRAAARAAGDSDGNPGVDAAGDRKRAAARAAGDGDGNPGAAAAGDRKRAVATVVSDSDHDSDSDGDPGADAAGGLAATAGGRVGPTLLVCPMSLVGNWQREAARFVPGLRVHVHHGAERARGKAFTAAVAEADLVITTYAIAARDAAALSTLDWHRLVVDEAQAIKNAATKQAVAIRRVPARHRIAVTGTPVENRLADLWSIMEFANPGLLGSARRFKEQYAEPVERRGDEQAADRLRRITQPFVLRRVKTDKSIISDLPEKLEMEVLCNLTAEQASLYQAVVDDMLGKIEASDGIERRGLVLATMTKLKQVCNHPAHLLRDGTRLAGRSGKLARLEEILDEVLAAGEKALLFTQYAGFGAMLRGHLSARFGREVAFLHGGVGKAERDALVGRFQEGGPAAPPLFVLSLKAGGTGLTLTAANHVVHVDRWWNPAVEDQATDRAFRIGQRRSVQVRKFVCAGTVEEKIAGMIRDKRGLAAKIVGTGEQWLTELSTAELRDLLRLDAGAVVE